MAFDPMIVVDDVEATSRFYQQLLGLKSAHGGKEYEMLTDAAGVLALQLHLADAEEHGTAHPPPGAPRGVGVVFYFKVADVRAAYATAQGMGATCEGAPEFFAPARHTVFVVRDPHGYAIAIFQSGEA
jgi:predicted enzyme related to lactoylglutathione lyase